MNNTPDRTALPPADDLTLSLASISRPSDRPLVRVYTLGPLTLEWVGRATPFPAERLASRGAAPALLLLKALISRPHRYAARDWLCEHLHNAEEDTLSPGRLDDLASLLRGLLCPSIEDRESRDRLRRALLSYVHSASESGPGYRLGSYPLIWVDIDALAWYVEQACRLERFGEDALPLWERAYDLAKRGEYLIDEPYSDWAEPRRAEAARSLRQSVHALARLYLAQEDARAEEEALRLLGDYWQQHVEDEDALRPLMELLGRHERYQEALSYYQRLCEVLEEEGRTPDARTTDLKEFLRTKQLQRSRVLQKGESAGNGRALPQLPQIDLLPLFSQAVTQGILQAVGELEGDTMDRLRRQLVGQVLTGTGAAFLTSYTTVSHSDILERLAKALTGPAHVDDITLRYLERHTATYWQDRHQAVISSPDLFAYVVAHLEKIIALLEQSLLPQERLRLCALASQTAQLAGHLLFDMNAYSEARRFHTTAIHAAHEADDTALEATAWARMSFTWSYSGHAKEALACIQHASALASGKASATTQAYLAAVEAEIQAILGEQAACLDKLNEAERLLLNARPEENTCWLRFDRSRLAGYQGTCFQRLYRVENPHTASFLRQAQITLQDALACLSPTLVQRRPALLIDLAGTYTHQGEIEGACEQAMQAVEVIAWTKSQAAIQRLLQLRQALDPWRQTTYVKRVDERVEALLMSNRRQEEVRGG